MEGSLTGAGPNDPVVLGRLEMVLLRLLVERPGKLITYGEIDRQLWGEKAQPIDRRVLISRLRRKLSRLQGARIETIRRVGFRLTVDSPASQALLLLLNEVARTGVIS